MSVVIDTPTSIGFAEIELTANNAVAISQSPFTFATQTHVYPGQMWQANVSIPPVIRELAEPWVAFLVSLRGPTNRFLLGDPMGAEPRGSVSGDTVLVRNDEGGNLNRAAKVRVDGFTTGQTGLLLPGDYIQLGAASTATLHKVLNSVDSDGSGIAEIDVWPYLRRDLTDDEPVTYLNARGLFRLAPGQQNWSINNSNVYGISFQAMEAIS